MFSEILFTNIIKPKFYEDTSTGQLHLEHIRQNLILQQDDDSVDKTYRNSKEARRPFKPPDLIALIFFYWVVEKIEFTSDDRLNL